MSTPDPNIYNFFVYDGRDFARLLTFSNDVSGWVFTAVYDNDTSILPIAVTPTSDYDILLELTAAEVTGINKNQTPWELSAIDDDGREVQILEGLIIKKSTIQ